MKKNKIIVAITGASGSVYAKQLLERILILDKQCEIAIIFSEEGKKVWNFELNEEIINNEQISIFKATDFFAPVASGSSNFDTMIVIPCSMGTLGRIAGGTSDNLIIRAADVILKEKRKLILVPREMPYNLIHIRNMETLLLAGAHLVPASPSFYSHPETLYDVIKTVTDKVLALAGYNDDNFEWGKK